MHAGRLKKRATIIAHPTAQDADYGTPTGDWTVVATVWCEILDVLPSRAETVKQGLNLSSNPSRVRMRYRTNIDSAMRLQYGGVTYKIVAGPAVIGNKEGIELMVERLSS